jgi:uncharacterized membrane protein
MTLPRGEHTAIARRAALASLTMLVLTQLLDSWVRQPPLVIWALRVLPLLIFVPGLIRDNLRTYIWLCFVILMYFLTLVLRLFNDPADPVAWVGMSSVVIFFTAAMMYARWRARELRGALDAGGGGL